MVIVQVTFRVVRVSGERDHTAHAVFRASLALVLPTVHAIPAIYSYALIRLPIHALVCADTASFHDFKARDIKVRVSNPRIMTCLRFETTSKHQSSKVWINFCFEIQLAACLHLSLSQSHLPKRLRGNTYSHALRVVRVGFRLPKSSPKRERAAATPVTM